MEQQHQEECQLKLFGLGSIEMMSVDRTPPLKSNEIDLMTLITEQNEVKQLNPVVLLKRDIKRHDRLIRENKRLARTQRNLRKRLRENEQRARALASSFQKRVEQEVERRLLAFESPRKSRVKVVRCVSRRRPPHSPSKQ